MNDSRGIWGRYTGWIILGILVFLFVSRIYHTLTLFGIALLIAFILYPVVNFISNIELPFYRKKIPWFFSIVIVYVLLASIIITSALIFIPNAIDQISSVIQSTPNITGSLETALKDVNDRYATFNIPQEIEDRINEFITTLTLRLGNMLEAIFKFIYSGLLGTIQGIVFVVISLLIAFFMLSGSKNLTSSFYSLIPTTYQDDVKELFDEINTIFGAYIRGTIILMFIYGFVTYAALYAVIFVLQLFFPESQFPYYKFALIASVVQGVFYFIPYIGCIVIVIVGLVLAFLQNPSFGYVATIGFIIFLTNQILDNTLRPKILGQALGVSTLFVLFAIFAGGELMGIWGLVLGVPVGVMLIPIYRFIYRRFLAFPVSEEVVDKETAEAFNKRISPQLPETPSFNGLPDSAVSQDQLDTGPLPSETMHSVVEKIESLSEITGERDQLPDIAG